MDDLVKSVLNTANGIPIVIFGAQMTGKSYFIQKFIERCSNKHRIYLGSGSNDYNTQNTKWLNKEVNYYTLEHPKEATNNNINNIHTMFRIYQHESTITNTFNPSTCKIFIYDDLDSHIQRDSQFFRSLISDRHHNIQSIFVFHHAGDCNKYLRSHSKLIFFDHDNLQQTIDLDKCDTLVEAVKAMCFPLRDREYMYMYRHRKVMIFTEIGSRHLII